MNAFGSNDENGNDWTVQLAQAKTDFPGVKYNDFTSLGVLSVTKENSGGAGSAEGSSKLVDDNYNTKFFVSGFPAGFEMQLTFPTTHIMGSYTITSGNDLPDRDPRNWQVLGSNNGTTWFVVDSRSGQTFEGRD
jgi:hypothetical protein